MITQKKLFLASSSELQEDRKEFEIFINRKNKEWQQKGVFLHLVVWEDFLDAVSKTRLQDEYNRAIRECDLFVMLFFTKVGQYTEEEFETAFGQFQATNKPFIFSYFKDAEITTGSANKKDLTSLWAFQEKLDALGHFYTRYPNTDALKYHFNAQLEKLAVDGFIEFQPDRQVSDAPSGDSYQASQTGSGAIAQNGTALGERAAQIQGDNAGTIVTGTQIVIRYYEAINQALSKKDIARQIAGYLSWLRARTEHIELRGIERAGGSPVVLLPLETAYVPLRAVSGQKDIDLNQALGLGTRLVVTGGPGSGKTTVLLHMAWALASSLLSGQAEPAQSRLRLTKTQIETVKREWEGKNESRPIEAPLLPRELPLPIFVSLASFARHLRGLPTNAAASDKTLAQFISHHLIKKQANFDLPADFFVQLLKDGQDVLLLLDGLDEVANEDERAEVRQSVEELVSGRNAMRVVVTCRTTAYRDGRTALAANFLEIAVRPLDRIRHVEPMVRKAYACIYPLDAALRNDRTTDLLGGIKRLEDERRLRLGDSALVLVDSPLMVRLLLIVHVNDRKLPDERADLFDKAINALLQVDYGREESDRRELAADWKPFRDMAQHLAYHMHQQGQEQGREIEEPALKKVLRQEAEFEPRIEDFLRHARERGSVLAERGRVYRFIHLALQEFLAARYLSEVVGRESRDVLIGVLNDRLDDPWWREPILLLAGYLAANAPKAARDFLNALMRAGTMPKAWFIAVELAGTAALERRESGASLRADCAQRIVVLLGNENALRDSTPTVRAHTGNLLSQLGDPRFDPQRYYLPADEMLGFVHIPADPDFRIGTRKADMVRISAVTGQPVPDAEINDAPMLSPECYIARYLVTVAQFRTYLKDTGIRIGDHRSLHDPDSRPVRWVDWHEALGYCRWLNEALKTSPVLVHAGRNRLDNRRPPTSPSDLLWPARPHRFICLLNKRSSSGPSLAAVKSRMAWYSVPRSCWR